MDPTEEVAQLKARIAELEAEKRELETERDHLDELHSERTRYWNPNYRRR